MQLRERSPSTHIVTGMTIPLLAASGSNLPIDDNTYKNFKNNYTE